MSQMDNTDKVIPEVSLPDFSGRKPDTPALGSPVSVTVPRFPRRGSSAVKMLSEDYNLQDTDLPSRRSSTPEKRNLRNSVVKLLEEQDFARRFSAPEKTRSRRSSSVVKTLSEEQEDAELASRRSSRSGSIVKMTSEDNFADDECSRRSSRADCADYERRRSSVRRGSSIIRTLSEEQHDSQSTRSDSTDRSDNLERFRKSMDNGYKHSLESISEYSSKTKSFYPSLESPTLDCLSDFAQTLAESLKDDRSNTSSSSNYISWLETVNSDIYGTPHTDSDNRSGEWNFFWKNYNSSSNQYFSSPYLCPSNSIENLSDDSNATQMDKGGLEKISFTLDEVNEALHCVQRVTDILKDALKRAEECDGQNSSIREETLQGNKTDFKNGQKPAGTNSCIEVFLNHTGVADILKKVLNKRREVLMPASDSRRSSLSGWTSGETTKKL